MVGVQAGKRGWGQVTEGLKNQNEETGCGFSELEDGWFRSCWFVCQFVSVIKVVYTMSPFKYSLSILYFVKFLTCYETGENTKRDSKKLWTI